MPALSALTARFFSCISLLLLFSVVSCQPANEQAAGTVEADSASRPMIVQPKDNAATDADQPGLEHRKMPDDSLGNGDGDRVIGTSTP